MLVSFAWDFLSYYGMKRLNKADSPFSPNSKRNKSQTTFWRDLPQKCGPLILCIDHKRMSCHNCLWIVNTTFYNEAYCPASFFEQMVAVQMQQSIRQFEGVRLKRIPRCSYRKTALHFKTPNPAVSFTHPNGSGPPCLLESLMSLIKSSHMLSSGPHLFQPSFHFLQMRIQACRYPLFWILTHQSLG